ncbi:MAG: hypothetical protein ABDH21_03865 [bacterium]
MEIKDKKQIICFVGLCKNVGKTTFLNKYIKSLESYLITSIGWDGEAFDHLFGIKKPSIKVKKNTLVCTYSNLKPTNSEKIIDLPIQNYFLGNLCVYRMIEEDIVQIAGPSSIKQIKILIEQTQKLDNINQIVLDGAADRRISLSVADTVYFIIGPTFSQDKNKITKTIKGIIDLLQIPVLPKDLQNYHELQSLNSSNINSLNPNTYYVLENPGKVIIDYDQIPGLVKKYNFFFLNKPESFFIVVNSFNADLMYHSLDPQEIISEFPGLSNIIPI